MLSDEKSRIAALSVEKSFIVQAPAGSGKTSLLVQRFINLLNICEFPEECLAITFTKKAALEMRNRVLFTLENLIKCNQYPKDHIYLRVLEDPNKLQILTIDAFSLSLIRKMPLLSKCWINFSIVEDPKLLYREAVEQLLSTLETLNSDALDFKNLIKLLEYFSNDYELIIELLINLLSKREQWLPLIVPIKLSTDFKIRNFLEDNLKSAIEEILIELSKYLPSKIKQAEILSLAKYAANNIEDATNPIMDCKHLSDTWPQPSYKDLPLWKGLRELLLTKDGKPRAKLNVMQGFIAANNIKDMQQKKLAIESKARIQQLLEDLKLKDQIFLSKLEQISILPTEYQYIEENWELLASLFELLPKLVAHLMVVFEEYQMVDFTQIAIGALEAVSNEEHPTDLNLIMEYKLKHILIDEFQDTSNLQFNLLEKLVANWEPNDSKTIFIVGDPMQSIYRFRQANVGLFLRVQEFGIGNIKPFNLSLTTNFRSSIGLVDEFNNLFSKIFPLNDDIIYGAVKYNVATHANNIITNEINHEILNTADVQFLATNNQEEEAEYIANLIKDIENFDVKLSIAILFKVKSQADLIIKKLKQLNIPYQANELELFANQEVINDLLMLTRAMLHVNDKIAWLALLRGSLVGLKLKDLNLLFEDNNDVPFFYQLNTYQSNKQLSKEALIRLNYVLPILIEAIEQIELCNLSIAGLIKNTWLKLGGNLIVNTNELELVENFFYKLAKIKDPFTIGCIDSIIEGNFIELNSNHIDLNRVQLMTIHKAKGLEFDIVILPGMDKASKNFQNQLLLWESRNSLKNNRMKPEFYNNYLLFAPIKASHQSQNLIYNFMKFAEEERDLHEAKRLLYVALTRAKKKFFGFTHNNNYASNKSLFKFLEPYINLSSVENLKISNRFLELNLVTNESENLATELSIIVLQRLPNSWYTRNLN